MRILLALLLSASAASAAKLGYLEQLPIETFKQLREVERHQLQVAERLYIKEEWEAALNEYEKYVTLYEASAATPYAQLMWSHCLVRQRKANTAIRDGFQSVIDYWPESREATLATFLIARTHKEMGFVGKAEKGYRQTIEDYPEHYVAFLSKIDLLELAKTAKDQDARLKLLNELTFETERTDQTRGHLANAARELASHHFYGGQFDEGRKAMETSYQGHNLVVQVHEHAARAVQHLTGGAETKAKGEALADQVKDFIRGHIPDDISEDGARARARDYYFRLAGVEGAARRGPERIKIYESMVKLFGADDGILGSIADWYIGAKRDEEAIKVFAKFQDQVAGQRRIVKLWRDRGKFKEAIEGYRGLIEVDPDGTGGYLWAIAELQAELKDYKNAILTYRQTDNYPEAYFRMGGCQRRLKQHKEALVLYNLAKGHPEAVPRAMMSIAATYEEMGEREKAIKTYQTTCRNFPKSGEASRAHAHLQNVYKISVTLGGATDK